MAEIRIETSEGDEFTLTVDSIGRGYLHAHPDGLCDKVRVEDWQLDNHDDIFDVDPTLEDEWDDLIAAHIARCEREWVESEAVGAALEELRALREVVWEMDKRHRLRRKEAVLKFSRAFNELLLERLSLPHVGDFDTAETRFDCCHSFKVQRIVVGDQVLIEDIP